MDYYDRVIGTIEPGKTARSTDINLIQSHIESAIQSLIKDMFGNGFVLGESENALSLYSTSQHRDQYNIVSTANLGWTTLLDTYYRQPIITTKSSIESITIQFHNYSVVDVNLFAEIRDRDDNLIQESSVLVQPDSKRGESVVPNVTFTFNINHLNVGLYYFVLRPVSVSLSDLTINGDENELDTIKEDYFLLGYDVHGAYNNGLQAAYDGSNYLNANVMLDNLFYEDENINPDLVFEETFSSGTTYLINQGSAVIMGQKVTPLDTHVTIDGGSSEGDRTDLVLMTSDGRLNVVKGKTYNTTTDSAEDFYPRDKTGLQIAYITTYQVGGDKWICPACNNVNNKTTICYKCGTSMPTGETKMPKIEQADEIAERTRTRDIRERLRRLEKKVNYQESNNSPIRIKYNCPVDPILANNGVDDDAATRGEGTYNVTSENDGTDSTITSTIGQTYAWSIIKNNYTYNTVLSSSKNAIIRLYNCATTNTSVPYDLSALAKGELLIYGEAIELGDGQTQIQQINNGQGVSGLKLHLQIKKGTTIKKTYDVTTNSEGAFRQSVWSAKLSKGDYVIDLIYGDEVVVSSYLRVYDGTSVTDNITTLTYYDGLNSTGGVVTQPIDTSNITIDGTIGGSSSSDSSSSDSSSQKSSTSSTKTEKMLLTAYVGYTVITENAAGTVTKTLPDGVIPGDDGFYSPDNRIDIDTENGEIKIKQMNNKGDEYTTNTLLKDTKTFDSRQMQYTLKSNKTSKYPLLHFTLERDTTIKSITPYIDGFQNIKEFGILIFKNDSVFSELENSRQTYKKNIINDDASFPTQYDSGYKSLSDLVKQSGNWKVLKDQVQFDINQDFDAGTYTLMIYAKEEDILQEGVIKITEYHTLEDANSYGVAATATGPGNLSQIFMDTADLSDWSWDIAITRKNYSFYTEGTVLSRPVSVLADIKAAKITKNLIIPEGCSAELYVSNNGHEFSQVKGNSIKFSSGGRTFRWKLVLYGTASATPILRFNPTRQFAISFTLATELNYVEYEDYHQCYETPLMNANIITRTYTNSPATDNFSTWEFARIFMEDEELQSKIDICISYAYDDYTTHVGVSKAGWTPDIFFNTIFADLSLNDFSHESVDYSNYTADVEYDEYNYQFKMDSDDFMQGQGGVVIADPDNTQDSDLYEYELGTSYNISDKFTWKERKEITYAYKDNDGDYVNQYAGMHLVEGPYCQATYLGIINEDGETEDTSTIITDPGYTDKDVILGVKFPSGLDINQNRTGLKLAIFAGINNASNHNDQKAYAADTFEVVVSTNINGEVDENEPSTGKIYPITMQLEADVNKSDKYTESLLTYNEFDISLLDDLDGFSSSGIYYIGIRAKNPQTAMYAGDSIGLGRISTYTGANISSYTTYGYGIWDRLGWKRISNNEDCKAYAMYTLGRKDENLTSGSKVFYPISDADDDINKSTRTLNATDFNDDLNMNGKITIWNWSNTSVQRKEIDDGGGRTSFGSIVREGTTLTTTLNDDAGYSNTFVNQGFGEILFNLPENVTGDLFKIEVNKPLTIYDLMVVQYGVFCEYTDMKNTRYDASRLFIIDENNTERNMYHNSNVRDDGTYYYITDGSFSKGEIMLDLYETTDTDTAEPVQSLALPSWGRVATQSRVSNKKISAWFKKETNSTKIRSIIIRRTNPRELDTLPRIRLFLYDMLFFNTAYQLALGPQMQLRIYPNAKLSSDFSNTKIRKFGGIYRLK